MNESIKKQILEVCGQEYEGLATKLLSYEQDIEGELTNLIATGHRDLAIKISKLRKLLREEEK